MVWGVSILAVGESLVSPPTFHSPYLLLSLCVEASAEELSQTSLPKSLNQ